MKRYQLENALSEIEEVGGGGTWHISLYIRPSKSIHQARAEMKSEYAEAEQIKSDDTRDRVQSALSSLTNVLERYSETPENGLVVFASPNETWVLDDLPFEVEQNHYLCEKSFDTAPLKRSFEFGGTYGLIVVERGEAAIGVLDGGRMVQTYTKESQVMGKTKAGGQSQARFERERDRQLHEFFKDVQETAWNIFKPYDLDGVVVGGTISSAKDFAERYMNHEWDHLGTYSVEYASEQGLEELVRRAQDALNESEMEDDREAIDQFLSSLREERAAYGESEVDTALGYGAVDTLIMSTSLPGERIENYRELAEQQGGDVVVVNPTFEKAQMFENISNGIGAILRFEI